MIYKKFWSFISNMPFLFPQTSRYSQSSIVFHTWPFSSYFFGKGRMKEEKTHSNAVENFLWNTTQIYFSISVPTDLRGTNLLLTPPKEQEKNRPNGHWVFLRQAGEQRDVFWWPALLYPHFPPTCKMQHLFVNQAQSQLQYLPSGIQVVTYWWAALSIKLLQRGCWDGLLQCSR